MAETPAVRTARLVAQAAAMRAAQAVKRQNPERHTCPGGNESPTDRALARLNKQLERHAVGNTAQIPVAMAYEEDRWTVDLHVKIPYVTEYEITSEGATLADAIAHAAVTLSRQTDLRRVASRDAEAFGITF